MTEWLSIAEAAELEGIHRVSMERRLQNKNHQYSTRKIPSQKHIGKTVTQIAVSSLSKTAVHKYEAARGPLISRARTLFDNLKRQAQGAKNRIFPGKSGL